MEEKVLNIISTVTKLSVDDLNSKRDEEKLWNSLVHIELVISLENEFNITFDMDELPGLTTVSRILMMIERKIG